MESFIIWHCSVGWEEEEEEEEPSVKATSEKLSADIRYTFFVKSQHS